MSLQWWKEWQTNNEVNEDVVRLIFLYLFKQQFFSAFIVRNTKFPRLLRGLQKNCAMVPNFLVYREEIKILILSKKRLILHENITPVSIRDEKMLLLTGKIEKACLVCNCFCLCE